MKMKIRRQPSERGVSRIPRTAGFLQEIDDRLTELQLRYRVSRSWIVATILADALKIRKQPRYYASEVPKTRRRA